MVHRTQPRHRPSRLSDLSFQVRQKLDTSLNAGQVSDSNIVNGGGVSLSQTFGFAFSRSVNTIKTDGTALVAFDQGLTWKIPNGNPYGAAKVDQAPSADTTFDIRVNNVSIGSFTIPLGQLIGTWNIPVDFVVSGEVTVVPPGALNGLGGLLRFSIIGTLV